MEIKQIAVRVKEKNLFHTGYLEKDLHGRTFFFWEELPKEERLRAKRLVRKHVNADALDPSKAEIVGCWYLPGAQS